MLVTRFTLEEDLYPRFIPIVMPVVAALIICYITKTIHKRTINIMQNINRTQQPHIPTKQTRPKQTALSFPSSSSSSSSSFQPRRERLIYATPVILRIALLAPSPMTETLPSCSRLFKASAKSVPSISMLPWACSDSLW